LKPAEMTAYASRRSRLQKRQRKILEHYGYVRPARRRREPPAVWVRESGRYPYIRPLHRRHTDLPYRRRKRKQHNPLAELLTAVSATLAIAVIIAVNM